jgi:hypothetical protein
MDRSSFRNLYIGPYVKCKNEVVWTDCDQEGCPNCYRSIFGDDKFCSQCGAKKGIYKAKQRGHRISNVLSSIEDTLSYIFYRTDQGYDIYIPNPRVKIDGIKQTKEKEFVFYGSGSEISVNNEEVSTEIEVFCTYFRKELDVIQEIYGESEVYWGVIMWR